MKSIIILCFGALFALFSITSALPTPHNDLTPRVKIGKPKAPKPPPAPAAPPKPKPAPPKPKTGGASKPPVDKCNGKACLACTKTAACGFNPTTLTCVTRATAGAAASSLVTAANPGSCPPLKQAAGVTSAASTDVNAQAKALLTKMSNHIFVGETTSTTSGRHTFTSWRAKNHDAGRCDTETHLCAFQLNKPPSKTIFDNRAGTYTQSDIETMCLTAIKLNLAASKGKKDGAFVVQNKFAHPICIQHQIAGQGSCFPLGIHATTSKLNSPCTSTNNNAINGRTVEVAAT